MKKIAFFCIPAHGHTNPMLPVAKELVQRGNEVKFYSFNEFREKIESTGAVFVSCDSFLPELTEQEITNLKKVSTTEMSIQDIRTTLQMDAFLSEEFTTFKPDVIYTDSVCFWGKLNAWKYKIPMVVSTSTFAFNQLSSEYMKNSPAEMADMIFGLPKLSKELKKLEPYGYKVKNVLSLVQSDNDTDSVVYTSRRYQPYAKSFSDHYCFAGPSVFSDIMPDKKKERPLVYVSMGTVINERPQFYHNCIKALKDMNIDLIISCGNSVDPQSFKNLPDHIKIYPRVNQLEILSKADAFITHCGMNSVSESLYMATPMILFPQTGEQCAVARRAYEIGAGTYLKKETVNNIKKAVQEILDTKAYADAAAACSADFRSCGGPSLAADFIENAPHTANENMFIPKLNIMHGKFQLVYWLIAIALIVLSGALIDWSISKYVGIAAGVLNAPIAGKAKKIFCQKLNNEKL